MYVFQSFGCAESVGWSCPTSILLFFDFGYLGQNEDMLFCFAFRMALRAGLRAEGKECGGSITPEALNGHLPETRARDYKQPVDSLGLKWPVLVGWSMGCGELMRYVEQFGTDNLGGLVLVEHFQAFREFDGPNRFPPALLTLTLGLGINCAIFTVVNAVLLQPLPYPDSERLVLIERQLPERSMTLVSISSSSRNRTTQWGRTSA